LSREEAQTKSETRNCVRLGETVILGKCGEYLVKGVTEVKVDPNEEFIFIAENTNLERRNVVLANGIFRGCQINEGYVMLQMISPIFDNIKIFQGTRLGIFEQIKNREICLLDEDRDKSSAAVIEDILGTHKPFLSSENYQLLSSVLLEFKEVFSKGSTDLGCAAGFSHDIVTGSAPPVMSYRNSRVELNLEDKVEELIKKLKSKGILRNSISP
jgi:hypothetical protein